MMNHKLLLALLSLAAASSLPLQASEAQLRQALMLCQQEQDTLLRLHCYDAIEVDLTKPDTAAPPTKPKEQASRQAATSPVQEAPAPVTAEDRFGQPMHSSANEPDRIYLVVSKVEEGARGHLIVTFENGHTWRQNSSEYYPIKVGEEHYIRRAMLGSFLLSSDSTNRSTRVRRIN